MPLIDPESDLREVDFTVVDVETTGLSPDRGDRVCEIGLVRVRGHAIVETFSSLIDPTVPVSAGAYAVNGISPAMLRGAPVFSDILGKVRPFFTDSVLVAYNAPFDVSFINNELRLCGSPPLSMPVVDVLPLARMLLPGRRRYPQAAVAELLNIPAPVSHRALEDTMTTAKILMTFISILKAYDFGTFQDLRRKDIALRLRAKRTERISQALASGDDLWIKYLSPADGEVTQRIVTPDRRTSPGGAPAMDELTAFCHVLQARKQFRIDYILDIRPVGDGRL